MKRTVVIVLILLTSALATACAGSAQETWEVPPSPPHELILPIDSGSDEQPISGGKAVPSPLDPIPGEEMMIRGSATIVDGELLVMESYPLQIRLLMKGSLPTPCHHLRAMVNEPDAQNRIEVEVFSLAEPDVVCIQMLQAFESSINLGPYPDGHYTVWVNGEMVGEFTQ